jgi:transposase
MTPAQWDEVRAHLRTGTTKTIAQLQQWIDAQWGIPWSYEGLRQALDRERIALKVPRPRHNKTDRAIQEAWKKGGSHPRSQPR